MKIIRLLLLLLLVYPQLGMLVPRKAPPGMQAVPGMRNAFLDRVEMTNQRWREYLDALRQENGDTSQTYRSALPDLALWNLAYGEDFLDGHSMAEYPVVGITHDQAMAYCRWLSDYISKREHRKVVYNLPSMKVYKLAFDDGNANKVAEGLYSTGLGFRGFLGLCDNAAEMTNLTGVAISGYNGEACLESLSYGAPSHALGFRCMARL